MKRDNTILPTLLACACLAPATLPARDVTFLATSDSHYREPDHRAGNHNDLNRASIEEMNRITDLAWPEKLGGGKIAKPLGVVMPGDLIDDGDRAEKGSSRGRITGDRLRAAYRLKGGLKFERDPEGRQQHTWNGAWEWKWLLDKSISSKL